MKEIFNISIYDSTIALILDLNRFNKNYNVLLIRCGLCEAFFKEKEFLKIYNAII